MKKVFLVAAALAMVTTAAEAKCTKKSLNGNWSMGFQGQGFPATMAGGVFSGAGGAVTFTLTSFNSTKCRGIGSGSFEGTPVTVAVASERIPGSDVSPNHIFVTVTAGSSSLVLTLQRL